MTSPAGSRIGATATCIGIRCPSLPWANTISGTVLVVPVTIARCSGQNSSPQSRWPSLSMWQSTSSRQRRPTTSSGVPAGDPLGRLAPVDDPAVPVADVHAVAQGIQDDTGGEQPVGRRLHDVTRSTSKDLGGYRTFVLRNSSACPAAYDRPARPHCIQALPGLRYA